MADDFHEKLRDSLGLPSDYPIVYDITQDLEVPANQWDFDVVALVSKHYGQISDLMKIQKKERDEWFAANPKPDRK